jgi:hypothetical protein
MHVMQPSEMPYDNITRKHFDSGDYPEAVRRAAAMIDVAAVRKRQKESPPGNHERIGVGFSIYCEQAAHGTSVYHGWGIPMVPGHEQCSARLTPDGVLELRIGAHSHGQGMETTLAQVASTVLGIDPENVRLIHGDTGVTPYSTGTWGSRSMVMSGVSGSSTADASAIGINTWEAIGRDELMPGAFEECWTSPAYSHCNFTALPALDDERAQPWVAQLLAMDFDNPAHRPILEMEGLRRWVLPRLDGYASLFEAVREQGISPRW